MALFDNSLIVNAPKAFLFNQMARSEAIHIWRTGSIIVMAATGKQVGENQDGMPTFQRSSYLKGDKIECTFQATARAMYGVAASEQFDADTIAEPTGWGAQEFVIAHYEDKIGIGKDKLRKYKNAGKEKKIDYLQEMYDLAEESRLKTIQDAVNLDPGDATSAPGEKVLGSWNHAISDGIAAGEANYKTYGTIDRSVAGNERFRPARINTALGNLTLNEIGLAQLQIKANLGKANCGWAGVNVIQRLRTILEGYTEAEVMDDFITFSAEGAKYSGIAFGLEASCPAGQLAMGDSRAWMSWFDAEGNLTEEGIIYVPTLKAGYVLPYDMFIQLINVRVNWWAKWKGINA